MEKQINLNERILKRIQNELIPLKKQEIEAKRLWVLGYKKYVSATAALNARQEKGLTTDIKKDGTINLTVKKLWDTTRGWGQKSEELTKHRDAAREAMKNKEEEIYTQEKLLAKILHEYQIQLEKTDGIVDKVFMLNDGVVAALQNMDKFLVSDVFTHLHEKATQKQIENSTLTNKIVIMTNSINIMDVGKVQEASALIDAFVNRVNPKKETQPQDEIVSLLLDLVKELLDVRIRVKAGPGLSRFLAIDLNEQKFPELKNAQQLLASATNYSRSGLYVRLFTRATKDDKWQPVRQS
ncbi:MAG: hypothetical protein WC010_00135 [Candidatus Absconditabacterales bacterium]